MSDIEASFYESRGLDGSLQDMRKAFFSGEAGYPLTTKQLTAAELASYQGKAGEDVEVVDLPGRPRYRWDGEGFVESSSRRASSLRSLGVPLWVGAPTAGMFTISAQSGSVTTSATIDGGLQLVASNADAYIDVVLVLPSPSLVRCAAVEVVANNDQNLVSAYFAKDGTFNSATMISRSLSVQMSGANSETHRSGARAHLWFSGTSSSAWTNSGTLDLDKELFTHFRLRISPASGKTAQVTLYSARINPVARSRIAVVSDDGLVSWLRYAVPVLQRRGIPSSLAVIPALIGTNVNYCTLQQLRDFVAAGNECIPHGPNTTNPGTTNLFSYGTHAERVADISSVIEYLRTNRLASDAALRCYAWPEGKYTNAQGDVSLLDAAASLGITFGRTVTRFLGFHGDLARTSKYSNLTVPIIGYVRQSSEGADTTEINNTVAAISYCAQNGIDAVVMLHNVIAAQGTWAATQSTDITVDKLIQIADALVTARKDFGAELVPVSSFA